MIVKHSNPCGAAIAATPQAAYELAYATDPTSAFGGIIAFNRPLDAAYGAGHSSPGKSSTWWLRRASCPLPRGRPGGEKERACAGSCVPYAPTAPVGWDLKSTAGGLLVQERDPGIPEATCEVTDRDPARTVDQRTATT